MQPTTTSFKMGSLGLIAAIVLGGMAACNSSDYTSNKSGSSDSSAMATMTSDSSTGVGDSMKAADSASAKTARVKHRKGKTSITWPMAGNEKISMDKEGVYNRAEAMPEFPGGQDGLANYINNHLNYSQQAIDNNTDGTIQVSFVVDENGKVVNPKVISVKKLGNGLDEEALRVFNNMPAWKPGKVNGKNVKTRLEVPITFQLEEA
ncbi:MAG TPA: energy transducer TonB [Puia sp.]